MSRRLNTTVQAGPFVFPAGTYEDDIDPQVAESISPKLWDDGAGADVTVSLVDLPQVQEALQAAETQLGQANETIADLQARIVDLEAELEAERARTPQLAGGDGGDNGSGSTGGAYDGLDVDALKAEIDKRNEDREPDDRISKRGGVETLVAALVADDQAQA